MYAPGKMAILFHHIMEDLAFHISISNTCNDKLELIKDARELFTL